MTGMGNAALKALTSLNNIEVCGVMAPKEPQFPFPFYPCISINQFATSLGLSLYEDWKLKEDKTFELIEKLCPDLIVVGSFTQIIPNRVISVPKFGVINLHPSLLPKYRGPTPIRQALMMGEKETGVSLLYIEDEKVDSGRIILQSPISIAYSDNAGTLRQKLDCLGEKVLKKAIPEVLSKEKKNFTQQNENLASYFKKLKPEECIIKLDQPMDKIFNSIRALSPYPLARLLIDSKEYKVVSAISLGDNPGETALDQDTKKIVKTKEGWVQFNLQVNT